MGLDDVFLQFLKRFDNLPNPRSVAEVRITTIEIEALSVWFSQQWGKPRMWCESTFQSHIADETFASPQEMFGAVLIILASEVCRARSNEDSVWPAVTAVLKADAVSFPALFVAGQPTTACKNAVAAGARRLKLRNLIDRYGAQEYFDTLKLQFGFTFRGAVRKLPQWLDGIGLPIAVRILTGLESEYGDLRSDTFTDLWKVLQDFRRNRVSAEYTERLLRESPWIRPEWPPELMRVAKIRPPRPDTALEAREAPDRGDELVCEIFLKWEYPAKPELSVKLNEEQIREVLGEAETAVFGIDGQVIDRWTLQENGEWRGRRDLPCQRAGSKPNLRPGLLTVSSEGELLKEIDLRELGMGAPLMVFDLKLGTQVDLSSRLDPGRDYALVCDTDLSIPGATQCFKSKDRAAYRLGGPWPQDLRVVCDGALYWQPRISEREPYAPIRLTLESQPGETVEVGSACHVNVNGVPEDATAVSLMAGGSAYAVAQAGAVWRTSRPFQVALGVALGEERIRIRVSGPGYARTITPKSSLNLRGIACFETESNADAEPKWMLLNRNRPLNRADGSGRARVFCAAESQLFEGFRFVGKISPRGLQMRDLSGWGAPLIVRSDGKPDAVLVEAVHDCGRGQFLPPLFKGQTGAYLSWRTPMPPGAGHKILVWSDLSQEPRIFGGNEISSEKDDTLWKLPSLGAVAVMAVSYKGVRSACYWATEPTINALGNARSPSLFALFRWLKVPILNSSLRPSMEKAVLQAPVEFVRGWLGAEAPPFGLVHRQAEPGLDTVIREFLWNYTDRNESKIERLARVFRQQDSAQSEAESFKYSLSYLGEICPSLSYQLAEQKLRGDKYRKYVRGVAAAMLHRPADDPDLPGALATACRGCATLMGMAPDSLQADVDVFGAHLDNRSSNYKQAEPNLRRLGETSSGRQFITGSLLLRLVERSRL